jgi:hypothetical protein
MIASLKIEAQGRYLSLKPNYRVKEIHKVGGHWYPVLITRKHKSSIGAKRDKITTYSPASRKRLLEKIARLIIPRNNLFVTLTYGQAFPKPLEVKKHVDVLGKRLMRAYPEAVIIWRMEFQERGAPHLHLLILGKSFIEANELRRHWLEVIGDEYANWASGKPKCPSLDIKRASSTRRVTSYVAKYIAKASNSFNTAAYLTAFGIDIDSMGRFWGIIGRNNLLFALLVTTTVALNINVFWQFRFEMGKIWLPVRFMDKGKGFSLFHDKPYDLLIRYTDYNKYIQT